MERQKFVCGKRRGKNRHKINSKSFSALSYGFILSARIKRYVTRFSLSSRKLNSIPGITGEKKNFAFFPIFGNKTSGNVSVDFLNERFEEI